MLKVGDYYFPSVNILGEWFFIIEDKQGVRLVKNRPIKGGTSLDKATALENKFNYSIYKRIGDVADFINGLLPKNESVNKSILDVFKRKK